MEDYQRAQAHYRVGQIHEAKAAWVDAETSYKTAVKLDGHKASNGKLDSLKERKKKGEIDY